MRWGRATYFWATSAHSPEQGKASPVAVVIYGVGILLVGMLLARWIWILFAPQSAALNLLAEPAPVAETARLFGVAAATTAAGEVTTLPDVQLVGVFAASHGKPGFAILKLDNKRQLGVAVGESVVAGTILKEVHADYVLLERAGLQHKVNLEVKYSGDKTAAKLASSMGAIPTVQETQAHQAALRAAQEARLKLQGVPAAPNAQNKPQFQNNSGSQNNFGSQNNSGSQNNRAESRAGLRSEHRRGQQDMINSEINPSATDQRGANLGQP